MPWYWTDDLAELLVAQGTIDECAAASMVGTLVALRSDYDTIEDAAQELMEDDEIPLAA